MNEWTNESGEENQMTAQKSRKPSSFNLINSVAWWEDHWDSETEVPVPDWVPVSTLEPQSLSPGLITDTPPSFLSPGATIQMLPAESCLCIGRTEAPATQVAPLRILTCLRVLWSQASYLTSLKSSGSEEPRHIFLNKLGTKIPCLSCSLLHGIQDRIASWGQHNGKRVWTPEPYCLGSNPGSETHYCVTVGELLRLWLQFLTSFMRRL